jgi:hypothetical protein
MAEKWTDNIFILLKNPLQILPNCEMSRIQYENSLARLMLVSGALLFWKYPNAKYYLFAVAALAFMFLSSRMGRELFAPNADANIAANMAELLSSPKQAKPSITIPAVEEDLRTRDAAQRELNTARKVRENKTNVQQQFYDREQAAKIMMTNVRELSDSRGAIVPTEEEQIFATRPSLQGPNDLYQTMFRDVPNDMLKYISNPA